MKKGYKLLKGNNMETLKKIPDNSIDSIVTDPPYGLSFMNKKWDYDVPSVEFWREAYRVLKPGGHILSFGGTRTYHRMVVNIEDAGFEIRDQIMWIYGSGFPKSHNIGKAVDKIEGNEREVVGKLENYQDKRGLNGQANVMENAKPRIDLEVTKGNSKYEGYGTALKPANEPICVARKPLSEKTVAANMMKWGTGGINIDDCRVGDDIIKSNGYYNLDNEKNINFGISKNKKEDFNGKEHQGRFPANIIFECICDEVIKGDKGEVKKNECGNADSIFGKRNSVETKHYSDTADIHTNPNCPCYQLDKQSGISKSSKSTANRKNYDNSSYELKRVNGVEEGFNDKDGASRFFYVAKVSKKERNLGLDSFEDKKMCQGGYETDCSSDKEGDIGINKVKIVKNDHPTLKPIKLMSYLIRLVTPENGVCLDPFMGSGSTGIAAMLEGKRFVGCELDEEYFKIAEKRIEEWEQYKKIIK